MLEPAAMVVFTIPPSQGCQPDCEGFSVHRTESGSASEPRFVRFGDVCTALGGGAKAWDMGAKVHELCRTAGFPVTNSVAGAHPPRCYGRRSSTCAVLLWGPN